MPARRAAFAAPWIIFFEIKGLPVPVNQYIIHAIESTER